VPAAVDAPPLDPSSGEARRLLADELAKEDYSPRESLLRRAVDIVVEWFGSIFEGASGGPLSWWWYAVVALVVLGVVVLVGWTLMHLEPARRARQAHAAGVFDEPGVRAAEYRRRAHAAAAAGDHSGAVVDGYRAVSAEGVERFVIDDLPGATAQETAVALSRAFPDDSRPLARAADVFGAVRYGGRSASAEDSRAVLALDARVHAATPTLEVTP
jgi:hypothetical protein